jgi:zinc protease
MTAPNAAAPDRSRAPKPGVLRPYHFPPFTRHRLADGLTVITVRRPDLPMVYLDLVVPAGAHHEPPGAHGLASLTGALLDEGSRTSSAIEIATRIDRLGAALSTGADWHLGYLSSSLLSRHLEEGLALLAEVATTPTFPVEEIDRLRQERLAELLRRRDQPAMLADDRFHRLLYGGQLYGSPLIGTEASNEAVDRGQILDFYRGHYQLSRSILVVVGDFDPDTLLAAAERLLGGSGEGPRPVRQTVEALPRDGVTVHLVDRPGAAQTELRMGHASLCRLDPDFIPFVVLNSLLGGKFTSRINLNLRERHGYTYSASSRFYARRGPAPFAVTAAVATESTGAAARQVLAEIRRLQQEPIGDEEVRDTTSYLAGVFPYLVQTLEGVARRLESVIVFDLPDDYYAHYAQRVQSIDRETVERVARQRLHPDLMTVVAVGPADQLRPQLEELGPVEVTDR